MAETEDAAGTMEDDVTSRRAAQIFIGDRASKRAVRVSHSGRLTSGDVGKINDILINDVIKGLTGCACMSGIIDVIWEHNFDRVINVQLGQ